MTRITKLKTLKGQELCSWYDAGQKVKGFGTIAYYNVFPDAYEAVADWANVDIDDVDYRETEIGDCFVIAGEPVAVLETQRTPIPSAQIIPITVNGRVVAAEFRQAAE